LAERAREPLRRMVAPLEPPVTVRRDEHERIDLWRRQLPGDLIRGECGQASQPVLLPSRNDRADALVVRDRRTRRREREPSARAFGTTPDRPRSRRAAALAEGRLETPQRPEAGGADLRAGFPAREAALRQQQIEHAPTLRRQMCR